MRAWWSVVRTWVGVVAILGVMAGCGGDGSAEGGGEPKEHTLQGTVTLVAEEAFVLAGATRVMGEAANIAKVDLAVFAHSDTLKLEAGNALGRMKVVRRGGRPDTVDSIADVPDEQPTSADRDILIDPEAGNAFTLSGNVSDGYARFRVVRGPSDATSGVPSVTLEYDVYWIE